MDKQGNKSEKILKKATFGMSGTIKGLLIFAFIIVFGVMFLALIDTLYLVLGIIILVIAIAVLIFIIVFIKNSSCTVTNIRIYGTVGKKEYSYKLDDITNTCITDSKNGHAIILTIKDGTTFKIPNMLDNNEVNAIINRLILKQECAQPVVQKTVESNNYIKELKDLKELLDAGVITQQEFEDKKKNLLQ